MRKKMLPGFAGSDVRDLGLTNIEPGCYSLLRFDTRSNLQYLAIGKFGTLGQFPTYLRAMFHRIQSVLFGGSDEEMVGIDAACITAEMPSQLSLLGGSASRQDYRCDMHTETFAKETDLPVTVVISAKRVVDTVLNVLFKTPSDSVLKPVWTRIDGNSSAKRVAMGVLPMIVAVAQSCLVHRFSAIMDRAGKLTHFFLACLVVTGTTHTFGQVWANASLYLTRSSHYRGTPLGLLGGV